jgi:hypothetical protein
VTERPEIPIVRGSRTTHVVLWGDGEGGAADLTGFTAEVHAQNGFPPGTLAISVADAAAGRLALVIDDSAGTLPQGPNLRFWFRLLPPGGGDIAAVGPIHVTVT